MTIMNCRDAAPPSSVPTVTSKARFSRATTSCFTARPASSRRVRHGLVVRPTEVVEARHRPEQPVDCLVETPATVRMLDRDEPEPPFDEPDPGQVLGERVQGAEPVVVRRPVPVLIGVADE